MERLKRRSFSGTVILEQWPDPPSLLDNARDRLRAMFLASHNEMVGEVSVPEKPVARAAPARSEIPAG